MKLSEREFLDGINSQLHNDTVTTVNVFDREPMSQKEREYKAALQGTVKAISKEMNKNIAIENAIWDRMNKQQAAQEGQKDIERLLEIAEDRNDYLQRRLEAA